MVQYFAAGLCILPLGLVAIAMGMLGSSYYKSISRNPSILNMPGVPPIMVLFAFIESLAILCLVISILLLYSNASA